MKKLTQEEFENRLSNEVKEIFDISEAKYKGANKPVKLKCKKCKHIVWKRPINLIYEKITGCPFCNGGRMYEQEEFIQKAQIANPDLDLSEAKYKGSIKKVKTRCKICGSVRWRRPDTILRGVKCIVCYGSRIFSTEMFIQKAKEKHGDAYDYSRVKFVDLETPVWIRCKKCGRWFQQKPRDHLRGCGCVYCNVSKGEKSILAFLKGKNIIFETQKRFKDCRDKFPLPFDFYIPSLNTCIEFQGIQHYEPQRHFGGDKKFESRIKHDKIKLDYCLKNHIRIIRVKYTENVKEILELYIR